MLKVWLRETILMRRLKFWHLRRKNKPTCEIEKTAEGNALRCHVCGQRSFFKYDIENQFCPACVLFHKLNFKRTRHLLKVLHEIVSTKG